MILRNVPFGNFQLPQQLFCLSRIWKNAPFGLA
jgi:hypothetical protein